MLEKTTSQTAQVAKSNNLLQSRPRNEENFFLKSQILPFFCGEMGTGEMVWGG